MLATRAAGVWLIQVGQETPAIYATKLEPDNVIMHSWIMLNVMAVVPNPTAEVLATHTDPSNAVPASGISI